MIRDLHKLEGPLQLPWGGSLCSGHKIRADGGKAPPSSHCTEQFRSLQYELKLSGKQPAPVTLQCPEPDQTIDLFCCIGSGECQSQLEPGGFLRPQGLAGSVRAGLPLRRAAAGAELAGHQGQDRCCAQGRHGTFTAPLSHGTGRYRLCVASPSFSEALPDVSDPLPGDFSKAC